MSDGNDTRALVAQMRDALDDIASAGEEAWGADRPCVKIAADMVAAADHFLVDQVARPRADCPECKGSGARDSGGTTPWGEPVYLPCDCSNAPSYECGETCERAKLCATCARGIDDPGADVTDEQIEAAISQYWGDTSIAHKSVVGFARTVLALRNGSNA